MIARTWTVSFDKQPNDVPVFINTRIFGKNKTAAIDFKDLLVGLGYRAKVTFNDQFEPDPIIDYKLSGLEFHDINPRGVVFNIIIGVILVIAATILIFGPLYIRAI